MSNQNNAAVPAMKPPQSGVTVRMYNPGFGDCFLLAFSADDNSGRYMLIDCGVHHQFPDREKKIRKVVEDIAKATANHLHIVAATHEHTDHLYGFKYGSDIFDKIDIDELWLAWTENPNDSLARQLKEEYGLRIRALNAAVKTIGAINKPLEVTLKKVLDFEFQDALAASAGGNAAQLEYLREKSKKKLLQADDYRRPGEKPISIPGVRGIKVYILGPPRNKDLIKKLEKKSELYPELTFLTELDSFAVTLLALAGEKLSDVEEHTLENSLPFDEPYIIDRDTAGAHSKYGSFFRGSYGFTQKKGHAAEWRRIENDWINMAERLALSINGKTNNTSLVFAIEISGGQQPKVLLFAADAQVGNWLSWEELSWPMQEGGEETIKIEHLLRRTVLYKVGHHGSRNATLSAKGLERMENTDLVAMIPVDQKWAKAEMGWEHPAEKLLDRLKEKTKGRIIRSDEIPAANNPPDKPDEATDAEWLNFISQLDWDRGPYRMWIQYTVQV
jgi:beta-lactamase superfamily II metal-dependent hydrolase